MSNEVTQWLDKIKELKQQLADSIREREVADESANKWRQLYTTEAQQRRSQTRIAQEEIEILKAQIQQLQDESSSLNSDNSELIYAVEQEVAQLQTIEELRKRLTQVILERDHLIEALKVEQVNHTQTRQSLTAVIGDTIEQLSKERGIHQSNKESEAEFQEVKN